MPASLIVIPYTILEISKFLGQLLVDDDDEKWAIPFNKHTPPSEEH